MDLSKVTPARHYKRPDGHLEYFDTFRDAYGDQAAIMACIFNAGKYMHRHDLKTGTVAGAIEDLDKAIHYLQFAQGILQDQLEGDLT